MRNNCETTGIPRTDHRTKQYGLPMEREHFRCYMSVKALVNATMIAGGRNESTTNDLKLQQVDFGSCLASYCQ